MPNEFAELINRMRNGDARAADELYQKYEKEVRMEVRSRMRDPRLRRTVDSGDVCQSVLLSFFVRAALGQYDLDDPAGVVGLLVDITRKKVASQARRERRQCRDNRRVEPVDVRQVEQPASTPTPSAIVAGEELRQAIQNELTEEERQLADRRSRGQGWAEIVAELGGTVEARKKQMERTIKRVERRFFGTDEEGAD
jgi:RNA polymerase sigma-70 factor (ECF subfamily)